MDWDNLYSNFKKFANRTADKINRTADIATMQVKLSMADKKLEAAYTALGQISYEHFTGDDDLSEQISRAVSDVNDALIEKKGIDAELKEARRVAAGAKAATAAERAAKEKHTAKAEEQTKKEAPAKATDPSPKRTSPVMPSAPIPVTDISDTDDSVEITVEEE